MHRLLPMTFSYLQFTLHPNTDNATFFTNLQICFYSQYLTAHPAFFITVQSGVAMTNTPIKLLQWKHLRPTFWWSRLFLFLSYLMTQCILTKWLYLHIENKCFPARYSWALIHVLLGFGCLLWFLFCFLCCCCCFML